MKEYTKPLENNEWAAHYNMDIFNTVVGEIENGAVSVWSEEMLKICPKGSKILEIGCGTGVSSLWLAKNERNVTALDYTESSVELVKAVADRFELNNIDVVLCDATKDLPFKKKQFDYIFQAGLLEHFEKDDQINLLSSWSKYCRYMISMIPNASSIPYRVGKQIMETNGTWGYGLEIPQHSFKDIFIKSGISVDKEYTIGVEWAQRFLPQKHYIKKFFKRLEKDGFNLEEMMQGYLLVTIGECK